MLCWFVGEAISRAVFFLVCTPVMLGIMVGMSQTDILALFVGNGSCMLKAGFTGYDTPRACFLWSVGRHLMFGIMAGMDLKNTFRCISCRDAETFPWSRLFVGPLRCCSWVDGLTFLGRVHRYTARGSPAIRAGKGWRGRRELAPRCSATQLGA